VPGPRLRIPLLQAPALTQTLADPPVMVMVVLVSETATPPTVAEPPGLMVVPLESQFPSTPGKTAAAGVGKTAQAIISSVAAVTAIRPAVVSRLPPRPLVFRVSGIRSYLPMLTACATGGQFLSTVSDSTGPLRPSSSAEGLSLGVGRWS
jgi:hypothetical protein